MKLFYFLILYVCVINASQNPTRAAAPAKLAPIRRISASGNQPVRAFPINVTKLHQRLLPNGSALSANYIKNAQEFLVACAQLKESSIQLAKDYYQKKEFGSRAYYLHDGILSISCSRLFETVVAKTERERQTILIQHIVDHNKKFPKCASYYNDDQKRTNEYFESIAQKSKFNIRLDNFVHSMHSLLAAADKTSKENFEKLMKETKTLNDLLN